MFKYGGRWANHDALEIPLRPLVVTGGYLYNSYYYYYAGAEVALKETDVQRMQAMVGNVVVALVWYYGVEASPRQQL